MKLFWKKSFIKAAPVFIGLGLTVAFFFIIFRYDGIILGINKLIGILKPFIIGGAMAYVLKTPYNWLEKKLSKALPEKRQGMAKGMSVVLVMLGSILAIYFILAMVIPALANSIVQIIRSVPAALSNLAQIIYKVTQGNEVINNYVNQMIQSLENDGMTWIRSHILPYLHSLMGEFASTFSVVFGALYNILIGIIICIYLLLSKSLFARQGKTVIRALLPDRLAEAILDELTFIDKTFVGFFAGKIVDSVIVGLICYVFCTILSFTMGLNNAVLIAVIVGITNIIPYFGPFIGGVPAFFLALMDGPAVAVVLIIFIVVLQQFDGNVLGPMLLSGSVGLSGFWVLFSITFFGGLMGFVGVLIGVPVFAIIYDLFKRFIHWRQKKKKEAAEAAAKAPADSAADPLDDEDPFEDDDDEDSPVDDVLKTVDKQMDED